MAIATTVTFICCHAGPAHHFSVFAKTLSDQGFEVNIYAAGPAQSKFETYTPFDIIEGSEEELAMDLAKKCKNMRAVITDVGHTFNITMQNSLAKYAPNVCRLAYYDNPESFVPGGYSKVAMEVMRLANKVLFANSNLTKNPTFAELGIKQGIGFYPIDQANKISRRRSLDQSHVRQAFFTQNSLLENEQKVLVYAGGNNEEYFNSAFPNFLKMVSLAIDTEDFSNTIIVLHQHPGAKKANRDAEHFFKCAQECEMHRHAPRFILSQLTTEDAQVLADAIFYYQTSMGPQFVLAGIPTIQVGGSNNDILVANKLCSVATTPEELCRALEKIDELPADFTTTVREKLGIHDDWPTCLKSALSITK
ncbi:MAG: hypothetical protein KAR79_03640 [Simkaniaceae bacterium]|nr:hypothetical protein [Simkaniaceae bacterium]